MHGRIKDQFVGSKNRAVPTKLQHTRRTGSRTCVVSRLDPTSTKVLNRSASRMPPRKSGTSSGKSNVVRRVVKTITTEEIMEEIVPDLKPKKTIRKKSEPRAKKSTIAKKTSSKRSLEIKTVKPVKGRKPTAKATASKASSSKNPSAEKKSAAPKRKQSAKPNSATKMKKTSSITPAKRQNPPTKQTAKQTSTKQRIATTPKAATRVKLNSGQQTTKKETATKQRKASSSKAATRMKEDSGLSAKPTSAKMFATSERSSFVPKATSSKIQSAARKKTATTKNKTKRSLQSPISKGNKTSPNSTAKRNQAPPGKHVLKSVSTRGRCGGPSPATSLAAFHSAVSAMPGSLHTGLTSRDSADSLPALVEPHDSTQEVVPPSTVPGHATNGDINTSGSRPEGYWMKQTVLKRTFAGQASSPAESTQLPALCGAPTTGTGADASAAAAVSGIVNKATLLSQPSLELGFPTESNVPYRGNHLTRSDSIESLPALIEPDENPTPSVPAPKNSRHPSHSAGASDDGPVGYKTKHTVPKPAYTARASSLSQLVEPPNSLIPAIDTAAGPKSVRRDRHKPEPTLVQGQSPDGFAALLGCNTKISACDNGHSHTISGPNSNTNSTVHGTGVIGIQNDEYRNSDPRGPLSLPLRKTKQEPYAFASLQSGSALSGARAIEQTEQKSCDTRLRPGSSSTASFSYLLNQTLSNSLSDAQPGLPASPSRLDETGVWRLTHETGYIPDGFNSYEKPERQELGTFSSRAAALQKGQHIVGRKVGLSWLEVQEAGDLEIVADTQTRWEVCWNPPDSEYSRVIASLISTAVGRWIVEVERGYVPNGFHAYCPPTRQTLGPFTTRELAVAEGKREVGGGCGWEWNEVVSDASFQLRENSSKRWEAYWDPPDSEYSHVVVKLLPAAQSVNPLDPPSASTTQAAQAPKTTNQLMRSCSVSAQPGGTSTQSNARAPARRTSDVWEVLHETGFLPDRFHSADQHSKSSLGFFSSRIEAMNKGKKAIGSTVGFSWSEVSEDGEFEVLVDEPDRWEVRWSPPADPYSHVTVRRFSTERGRWFIDIDHDCHSHTTSAKKTRGPFLTRDQAVEVGKKEIGAYYGYEWEEVVSGGELEVSEDTSDRWVACWSPVCSLHMEVVAFLLPEPQIREGGA